MEGTTEVKNKTTETVSSGVLFGRGVADRVFWLFDALWAFLDGRKTMIGAVLVALGYAIDREVENWGVSVQVHTWITPLVNDFYFYGSALAGLGSGHKGIKNKEDVMKLLFTKKTT